MGFPRPVHDIADIVRTHRGNLEKRHWLSRSQKRVLTAISRCRTAALGGHLEVCTGCGREHPVYNSCRNRHCPKCQASAQQKWIDARAKRILDLPHFHLVFTLPSELKPLAKRYSTEVYGALSQVVSELLLELGRTKYKATLGLTMVLHTWTRDLRFHPHLHVLATAGGLSWDRKRFVHVRKSRRSGKRFLFDVEVMGLLLRGKMLDALRKLHQKGTFTRLASLDFHRMMARAARHRGWVVYAKEPFSRSQYVLAYLGRYTHRVGIANSRLLDVGPDHVTFRTKGKGTAILHPVDFLGRFIQHVLPDGFHKIRHAGLYASPGLLEEARALLPQRSPAPLTEPYGPKEAARCSDCGGLILRIRLARAPPLEAPCI